MVSKSIHNNYYKSVTTALKCLYITMKTVSIYTDGACSGNQNETNIGGWGCILVYGEHQKELWGGERNTTNNRMELTAVIEALKALRKEGLDLEIYSDSSYVMNCFRDGWYLKWQQNGWMTSRKEPVENKELWQELIALALKQNISFYRVKGHVSLKASDEVLMKRYMKFIEMNGQDFSYADFLHVTEMNNRADRLANIGIGEIRGE